MNWMQNINFYLQQIGFRLYMTIPCGDVYLQSNKCWGLMLNALTVNKYAMKESVMAAKMQILQFVPENTYWLLTICVDACIIRYDS